MTHEEAFLADIREHPDDDAPRLIYADWLDDAGDPDRATFLRAQVEQARLPLGDRRHVELARRIGTLLLEHESSWRDELPHLAGVTWENFSRGFVEAVWVESAQTFLEHAEAIFAAAPIRRLQLGHIVAETAPALARSPHLARLTELNVGNSPAIGRAGVRALAESPHVENLTVLLLHYCALGDDAVADLARSPHLGRLRELYLSGNELDDPAALAIARSAALPALAELDLRDNSIGDAGARALAYYGRPRLETLWLVNNLIGPEGAWALAGTEALPALARLYLNYNAIRNEGAVAFALSPHRGALRELDLRGCGIRERGAKALAESPHLGGLELLWLGGNRLRNAEVARLRRRFGERLRM